MKLSNKKVPPDFSPNENISKKIMDESKNNAITCASAFKIAELLGIQYLEVGFYADSLNLKLSKCRIGLFGHGKGVKLVKKLDTIDNNTEKSVDTFTENERLSCENVLKIADDLKINPIVVGSVCQTKGIKIKNCCLGAF